MSDCTIRTTPRGCLAAPLPGPGGSSPASPRGTVRRGLWRCHYVVLSGRARFTLDGVALDAPAGTLVFLPDPATRRHAVAEQAGAALAVQPKVREWGADDRDLDALRGRPDFPL
jgi:hypothetical protein